MLAIGWGENWNARAVSIAKFGTIQRVALPAGVSSREDISTFEVDFGFADDFARLSINNYGIYSTEQPQRLIVDHLGLGPSFVEDLTRRMRVTRNYDFGRKDKKSHLVDGRNFIVYEVDNGPGHCGGGFRLFVNGQEIAGRFGSAPFDAAERRELHGSDERSLQNALCSRHVVQIDLGTGPEPLARFRDFIGR
jgi:hypothetical protein